MMRNAAGVSVSCGVEKSGATQKIRCHPRRFCFNPNFEGQTGALHELVPPRSPSRPKAPYCAIILEYASSQLTAENLGREEIRCHPRRFCLNPNFEKSFDHRADAMS